MWHFIVDVEECVFFARGFVDKVQELLLIETRRTELLADEFMLSP